MSESGVEQLATSDTQPHSVLHHTFHFLRKNAFDLLGSYITLNTREVGTLDQDIALPHKASTQLLGHAISIEDTPVKRRQRDMDEPKTEKPVDEPKPKMASNKSDVEKTEKSEEPKSSSKDTIGDSPKKAEQ